MYFHLQNSSRFQRQTIFSKYKFKWWCKNRWSPPRACYCHGITHAGTAFSHLKLCNVFWLKPKISTYKLRPKRSQSHLRSTEWIAENHLVLLCCHLPFNFKHVHHLFKGISLVHVPPPVSIGPYWAHIGKCLHGLGSLSPCTHFSEFVNTSVS